MQHGNCRIPIPSATCKAILVEDGLKSVTGSSTASSTTLQDGSTIRGDLEQKHVYTRMIRAKPLNPRRPDGPVYVSLSTCRCAVHAA